MEYRQRWPYVLTDHVFTKVRTLNISLAKFEQLLGTDEAIEHTPLRAVATKQLLSPSGSWGLAQRHARRADRLSVVRRHGGQADNLAYGGGADAMTQVARQAGS